MSEERVIEVDDLPGGLLHRSKLGYACPICNVVQIKRDLAPSEKARILRHERRGALEDRRPEK